MMDYATELKPVRHIARLTQVALAKRIGCSLDIISRWERGHCQPTPRLRKVIESDALLQNALRAYRAGAKVPKRAAKARGGKSIVFGMKLSECRAEADLTIFALATIVGVSESTVRNWESGRDAPSEVILCKLYQMFPELHAEYSLYAWKRKLKVALNTRRPDHRQKLLGACIGNRLAPIVDMACERLQLPNDLTLYDMCDIVLQEVALALPMPGLMERICVRADEGE